MATEGKVCTGFSLPYVAQYTNTEGAVTYSNGQKLARGVSVSVEPEVGDNNNFYANNIVAETVGGKFTGGTVTLTVDGLLQNAEKFILGLPTASTITVGTASVDIYKYGDEAVAPYVGIGFIARYMSDGATTYRPVVLRKARFNQPNEEHNTQEEDIDFQTQELEAVLMRDDTDNHDWKWVGADQATEADAENVIKAILNIT